MVRTTNYLHHSNDRTTDTYTVKQRQVGILDSDRLSFVFTGHTVCLSRKVMGIAEDSSKQGDFGGNEKEI